MKSTVCGNVVPELYASCHQLSPLKGFIGGFSVFPPNFVLETVRKFQSQCNVAPDYENVVRPHLPGGVFIHVNRCFGLYCLDIKQRGASTAEVVEVVVKVYIAQFHINEIQIARILHPAVSENAHNVPMSTIFAQGRHDASFVFYVRLCNYAETANDLPGEFPGHGQRCNNPGFLADSRSVPAFEHIYKTMSEHALCGLRKGSLLHGPLRRHQR